MSVCHFQGKAGNALRFYSACVAVLLHLRFYSENGFWSPYCKNGPLYCKERTTKSQGALPQKSANAGAFGFFFQISAWQVLSDFGLAGSFRFRLSKEGKSELECRVAVERWGGEAVRRWGGEAVR